MSGVAVFTTEDGSEIRFDVDGESDRYDGEVTRGLRHAEVTERAVMSFDDVARNLSGPLRTVVAAIRQAAHDVDELEVAFGVRFSVSAGAIISQVGGEANLSVTMRWKKVEP
jgi:Trypsin-co-occurring domain 1